ncbi:MAG: flagellar hook-associated protein FlgL [Desulfovibrionales bacterium]|nr:flagellar hook-associated protein FlgL [Desulfovibrionales bacterium]
MRVSLRSQYSSFLYNLENTQSRLMELNTQASSQKRINQPSDDAIGAARILNYRSSLSAITQYQANIDTASGWLGLADESMTQVSTILSKLKALAEQGSTGTMTAPDRQAIAHEARQLFSQLVNLANTTYEGSSIFAGHKFDANAYAEALMVYDQDGNALGTATGSSTRSIMVQFLGDQGATAAVGGQDIDYRYSKDGGATWTTQTLGSVGPFALDLGGVSVALQEGYEVALSPASNTKISSGSWLTIAPTAMYMGDHESQSAVTYQGGNPVVTAVPVGGFSRSVEVQVVGGSIGGNIAYQYRLAGSSVWAPPTPVEVNTGVEEGRLETPYGAVRLAGPPGQGVTGLVLTVHADLTGVIQLGASINAVGKGVFPGDVMVRIDSAATIGSGTAISYSYSTDRGLSWSAGHSAENAGPDEALLLVPGGRLMLTERDGNGLLAENAQFVIHPQTARHNLEISAGQYVQINNIGSEIFGGYYENGAEPVFADSDVARNIFVSVGKLVAALENNDQQGCAAGLENLKVSQEYFSTQLASVGARENRLDVAGAVLAGLKLNQEERMSAIEDVDLASLLTDLSNQQLAYQTVLKSSSMIMRMSLVDYL